MSDAKRSTPARSVRWHGYQDIEKYLGALRFLPKRRYRKSSIGSRSTSISPPTRVLRATQRYRESRSMIEERIEDLNATLRRVIQQGRYLRLQPARVTHAVCAIYSRHTPSALRRVEG